MHELVRDGEVIFTGTYRQCVMKRAELLQQAPEYLVIRECSIDPDGSTGYVL